MSTSELCKTLLPQFRLAGETLFATGCNNSHSGNLSILHGETVVITRTGAMLGALGADDLVVTSFEPGEDERRRASSELPVHLVIYEKTGYTAVAHGHAVWAVLAGWFTDELKPLDVEAAYHFGRIPIVECVPATASPKLGDALAGVLRESPVVILRGHGVFSAGATIEQAMQRICSVNDSAHLFVEAHRLGLNVEELATRKYLEFGRPA